MRLDLKAPYKKDYTVGYVFKHKLTGRRYVKLYDKKGKIFVTTYARYVMATHLGRYVPKDLQVDHIDNDKTNDDISNLQLLTPRQNKDKHSATYHTNVVIESLLIENIFATLSLEDIMLADVLHSPLYTGW